MISNCTFHHTLQSTTAMHVLTEPELHFCRQRYKSAAWAKRSVLCQSPQLGSVTSLTVGCTVGGHSPALLNSFSYYSCHVVFLENIQLELWWPQSLRLNGHNGSFVDTIRQSVCTIVWGVFDFPHISFSMIQLTKKEISISCKHAFLWFDCLFICMHLHCGAS